jgi:hypothetical protein
MALTEKDGYGAAWDSDKSIGWIKSSYSKQLEIPSFCEGFSSALVNEGNGGPLLVHARTSTNEVCLPNTHPFVNENYALIHNGVVESNKYTNSDNCTCDSELILKAFMHGGIEEVSEHISGWYACTIIEKLHNKTILHVFRDRYTKLFVGKLGDAYAFGTTERILENIGADVISLFRAETYCRFVGNKCVHQSEFDAHISTALTDASRRALGTGHYTNYQHLSKKARKKLRKYHNKHGHEENTYDFMKDMEDEGLNGNSHDYNPEDKPFGDY